MLTAISAQAVAGVVAVGDPASTRLVLAAVVVLVLVGLGLIIAAVWLWRETRIDDPVLLPLERMGERRWLAADPVFQRRMLEDARPDGAVPLHVLAPLPEPDLEFDHGPGSEGIADLIETGDSGAGALDVMSDSDPSADQPQETSTASSGADSSSGVQGLRPPQ